LQNAELLADAFLAFAFPQTVRDRACKVQTLSLMPPWPLPYHSMYVIVLAKCRPCR
jgi:hypothetical protein